MAEVDAAWRCLVTDEPSDKEDLPWARPGAVRRDCEPNRAPLVKRLGWASLLLGLFSLFLWVPALVGLPLALLVAGMARHDLTQMGKGARDPSGAKETQTGRDYAVAGVVLCLGSGLSCLLVLLLLKWGRW